MSHDENKQTATGHITVGKYMIGFVLAIVLTVISFGLAAAGIVPKTAVFIGLVIAAAVQMIVHIYYFLHIDGSPEMRWNLVSIVFTALILFIFVGGTVWVIASMNSRMM